MEFEKVVRERRSVRSFKTEAIPHETFEKIVELARFAPSWKNTQIVRYIVVDSPDAKAALCAPECAFNFTYNCKTLQGAAAIVLLTYKTGVSGFERDGSFSTPKKDTWQNFDAGIAAQTFCLAAHEQGVGTVIMGYFDEDAIRKVIEIPASQSIGAVIACGYPTEDPSCPPRKEVSELLSFK